MAETEYKKSAEETTEAVREPEATCKSRRSAHRRRAKRPLVLLLILLLLAALGGWWWWNHNQKMDDTTKYWFDKMAQTGSLEGKTPQEVQGLLNAIVEEGMFNVSINARAVFQDGKSEGSLGIENVPENRYYCRVKLLRDDDGTVLYESQGLKPGQYIDKIKLKKNLPAGEYPCTAQIVATDPESLDDIGQVQVKVTVIVVN